MVGRACWPRVCRSANFEQLLTKLVERVGDRCCVGIGTTEYPEQLEVAARCGAVFALSPVRPTWDFVRTCHSKGVLAVPAAFSPQEIYEAYERRTPASHADDCGFSRAQAVVGMCSDGVGERRPPPSKGGCSGHVCDWRFCPRYEAGARIIKVFPAQLWSPDLLKQVRRTLPLPPVRRRCHSTTCVHRQHSPRGFDTSQSARVGTAWVVTPRL